MAGFSIDADSFRPPENQLKSFLPRLAGTSKPDKKCPREVSALNEGQLYFDAEDIFLDNENKQFSGRPNRYFG